MSRKIIITGVKGGTGKSFVAFLVLKKLIGNKKVLFIDMDNTLTVSRLLGILHLDDIYNDGNNRLDFWSSKGVTVVPMGAITQGKLKEFKKLYNELVKENEIIIIDSSNISNQALDVEARLMKSAQIDFVIVSTPQPFSLKTNLDTLISLDTIYPATPSHKVLVLNMTKDESFQLPCSVTFVTIPFIRELYINRFSSVPEEFPSIKASIKNLLYSLDFTELAGALHGDKRDS